MKINVATLKHEIGSCFTWLWVHKCSLYERNFLLLYSNAVLRKPFRWEYSNANYNTPFYHSESVVMK